MRIISGKSLFVGGSTLLILVLGCFLWQLAARKASPTTPAANRELQQSRKHVPLVDNQKLRKGQFASPNIVTAPRMPGESLGNLDGPAQARVVLTNAVRCALYISSLIERVPVDQGNARRQLEGLRSKLFADDWQLATLYDPSIDGTKANEVLERLLNAPGQPDVAAMLHEYRSSVQKDDSVVDVADRFSRHYQRLLQSRNPGYAAIANVLASHTTRPGQGAESDLLKDATIYVGLRTWALESWSQQQKDYHSLANSFAADLKDSTSPSRPDTIVAIQSFQQTALEGLRLDFESILAAYEQVFDWRFREKHGIAPSAMMADLAKLGLTNVSPLDLSMPQ